MGRPLVFALPPSRGKRAFEGVAGELAPLLSATLGERVVVSVAESYDAIGEDVLAGRADAAWAPPFICAHLEAVGARVAVRAVRGGATTYRSALVCRAEVALTPKRLEGTTALWVDHHSMGGYLLPLAFLRAQGVVAAKAFYRQLFVGSYRAALEGLLEGKGDVASVFVPHGRDGQGAVEAVLPGSREAVAVVAVTDEESISDGVVVAPGASEALAAEVEAALVNLPDTAAGTRVLEELFQAECFEPSAPLSYRALYQTALSSL